MKSSKKLSGLLATFLLSVLIVFSVKCSRTDNGVYAFFNVDVKPKMLVKASPQYPEDARKAGIEGLVVVTVIIDKDGSVLEAEPLNELPERDSNGKIIGTRKLTPPPQLVQAALEAAKKCTFAPAQKEGHPVKVKMNIPFRFKLK